MRTYLPTYLGIWYVVVYLVQCCTVIYEVHSRDLVSCVLYVLPWLKARYVVVIYCTFIGLEHLLADTSWTDMPGLFVHRRISVVPRFLKRARWHLRGH